MKEQHRTSLFYQFGASGPASFGGRFRTQHELLQQHHDTLRTLISDRRKITVVGDYQTAHLGEVDRIGFPDEVGVPQNECVLDSWAESAQWVERNLVDQPRTVILTMEYLAALYDPRPLLLGLKHLALKNGSDAVVIWSPGRSQGYRFWTLQESVAFFTAAGFIVHPPEPGVLCFRIEYSLGAQLEALRRQGFGKAIAEARSLLVVNEHASSPAALKLADQLQKITNLVAVLGFGGASTGDAPSFASAFKLADLVPTNPLADPKFSDGMGVIEASRWALFALPKLRRLEFFDQGSVGFKLVQGRKTGVLPKSLQLRVLLQGSVEAQRFLSEDPNLINYSVADIKAAIKDDYIYKNVDACLAPNQSLSDLMSKEFGHTLRGLTVRALPRPAEAQDTSAWIQDYEALDSQMTPALLVDGNPASEITVAVPIYNTKIEYVEELFASIQASRVQPSEVVLIDDGSQPDYAVSLEKAAARSLAGVNYRIVRQENRGLAGARNRGLAESHTPFTFFIDSDDVLVPHTLQMVWLALKLNPNFTAATGIYLKFADTENRELIFNKAAIGDYEKGLGVPEGKAFALVENQYIPASVMVRTEKARSIGGWDDSDRSTWEDYAFYTRLAWSGHEFSLIPDVGYLYRDTPGSMSKVYSRVYGRRRLVRNVAGLSKLDANIMMSLMQRGREVDMDLSKDEVQLIHLKRRLAANPTARAGMKVAWLVRAMFRKG
jgi:glycosyltransferase involved in cell wall biosynthesis